MNKEFKKDKQKLKLARDLLLRLHKVLMERDRERYEREHGEVSPGRFLGLLLSDTRFEWLRVLSTLIVRIDEAFDLNDGLPDELIKAFRKEITEALGGRNEELIEFRGRFDEAEGELEEVSVLKNEILSAFD